MGMWDATKALFSGRPGDAADLVFVDSETVEASNAADRGLDELNKKQRDAGSISETEYRARLARITNNAMPDFIGSDGERGKLFEQPGTNPSAGFWEGLNDGAKNIRTFAQDSISGTLGFTAKLIPWQVWVVLGLYLAFITMPFWAPTFAAKLKFKK